MSGDAFNGLPLRRRTIRLSPASVTRAGSMPSLYPSLITDGGDECLKTVLTLGVWFSSSSAVCADRQIDDCSTPKTADRGGFMEGWRQRFQDRRVRSRSSTSAERRLNAAAAFDRGAD